MDEPAIRPMRPGEAREVATFVDRVFTEFVAPQYSEEGIAEFRRYIAPAAFDARAREDHTVWVAEIDQRLAGIVEIRSGNHLALLFVDGGLQGRGIARALVSCAIGVCRARTPDLGHVTVNASPNAIGAYERFGFRATDGELVVNGIRFTPMALEIGE